MTQLLERAILEINKLPDSEQDSIAAILFDELASEHRWSDSFAKSQDVLVKLADEALAEHIDGKTQPF